MSKMCIKVYHHSMNSHINIDICVLYIDIYLQYIDPWSLFCFRHAYCIVLLWPWEATIYEFRLVYYMTCSQADVSWDRFNFECFVLDGFRTQIHRFTGSMEFSRQAMLGDGIGPCAPERCNLDWMWRYDHHDEEIYTYIRICLYKEFSR